MQTIDFVEAKQQREEQRIMSNAATIYADRAKRLFPVIVAKALQQGDAATLEALLKQLETYSRLLQHEGAKP